MSSDFSTLYLHGITERMLPQVTQMMNTSK